ncbi:ExbD/TolR family protein [Thalassotalea piscium]|uniref:Biopolymer transport protein ExbD n=1 Tax=Thalassotalea piscium TaxID=1230533 RepID=A0A7X0TTH7_9GAMM|nr:biopolymer transporter ExbD [Thalassotalea piscium]MBB6543163.1 biopolymer transport protein ExbD [Thalassotalea piscium]
MSRKRKAIENNDADVDMTPMLDIVFILLIFFIVTTSFVKEEGLLINKPKPNKNPSAATPMVLVKITESGIVSLNNKIVDIERLPARIESFLAENATTSAVVIADYKTNHKDVVSVIDKINEFPQLTVSIGK